MHSPPDDESEPRGDLCTRTLAMPADTNANGDIFGGWLLSQMDIAGGVAASKVARSRTVTVSIDGKFVQACAIVTAEKICRCLRKIG